MNMPSFFHLRQHLSLSHQQHVWLCTETCNLVWLVTSYPVAAAEQQGGRLVTFALQRLTTWKIGAQQRKRRRCTHRHLPVQLRRKRPALHLQALLAVRACSPCVTINGCTRARALCQRRRYRLRVTVPHVRQQRGFARCAQVKLRLGVLAILVVKNDADMRNGEAR